MKVLFSALHFANFRNYESAIRGLADAGHRVHLIATKRNRSGGRRWSSGWRRSRHR
jgi:hypothetical protein